MHSDKLQASKPGYSKCQPGCSARQKGNASAARLLTRSPSRNNPVARRLTYTEARVGAHARGVVCLAVHNNSTCFALLLLKLSNF